MKTLSLFAELKEGGYDSCLMTTFNVDFPFYEEVLLRRMRSAGIYHHVLLADRGMMQRSFSDRPPQMAGRQYSLLPMDCPGAFHPKIVLLLGKHKGFLAVGSHNVTLSGFGHNWEVTNIFRYRKGADESHLGMLQAAYNALLTWAKDYGEGLPSALQAPVDKVKELYPWLTTSTTTTTDVDFFFSSRSTPSLWDQVSLALPDKLESIHALSAFFDQSLTFVNTLKSLEPEALYIGVQPDWVQAPPALVEEKGVSLVDSRDVLDQSSAYVHAKLIAFESGDSRVLISGSANLSAPAWLADGAKRNAEAVVLRRDNEVGAAITAMGLDDLASASSIQSLTQRPQETSGEASGAIPFLIIEPDSQGQIRIPIAPEWGSSLAITGQNAGHQLSVPYQPVVGYLVVDTRELPSHALLTVSNDALLAHVLVHHTAHIAQYSLSGTERKLRVALGSLGTNSPDINIIFSCIDQLTDLKKPARLRATHQASQNDAEAGNEAPDSLLTELAYRREAETDVRRMQLQLDGDAGLVMDVLISNMGIPSVSQSFNEDQQGRNEEELVDSDDAEEIESDQKSEDQEREALCRRKFGRTVERLKGYAKLHGREAVSGALAVAIVGHGIVSNKGMSWVNGEDLDRLFRCIMAHIFQDQDPFYDEDEQSDVQSDHWGRLLGYTAWLAFHAGISMQGRLPLSAASDKKNQLRWANACWLYLSQHISADPTARSDATALLGQDNNPRQRNWLDALLRNTPAELLNSMEGFSLARSPKGAFSGYRLVVDQEDRIHLAGIKVPYQPAAFGKDYLKVIKPQ